MASTKKVREIIQMLERDGWILISMRLKRAGDNCWKSVERHRGGAIQSILKQAALER
jgi:predicted RNA binding protein YcfA (HicA-like mRNA interferase family)